MPQSLNPGQQFLPRDRRRQGAGVLVAHAAFAVNQKTFGYAVNAQVNADPARQIKRRRAVGRTAVRGQPAPGALAGEREFPLRGKAAGIHIAVAAHFLVIEADDGKLTAQVNQQRMLHAAGQAPRRPDVEQPHFAAHLRGDKIALALLHARKAKIGQRTVDQRRRQGAALVAQAKGQQRRQGEKEQ